MAYISNKDHYISKKIMSQSLAQDVLTFIHLVGLLANLAPPVIDLGNCFEILY